MQRLLGIGILLFVLSMSGCMCAAPPTNAQPTSVLWSETPEIIGSLGLPIGTFMDVTGRSLDRQLMMTNPINVYEVNGKKLATPVLIEVPNSPRFAFSTSYHLRGYECFGYSGTPKDPADKDAGEPQAFAGYRVWFLATKVRD